jgi:hypothetical protein
MSKGPPHWWRIVVVAVAAGLLSAACGSSTTSSGGGAPASPTHSSAAPTSPAASPASPVCQDVAALRTSLNTLTHVKIGKGTVGEIMSDVADVQAKLSALIATAKGEWQAQTSALQSALGKFKTALSDLKAHPGTSTISGAVTALGGVSAAAGSLLTAAGPQCGTASPSPSA